MTKHDNDDEPRGNAPRGSAYANLTLGTNIALTAATTDNAAKFRRVGKRVSLVGALEAGGSVAAGATVATVATATHRPVKNETFTVNIGVAGATTAARLTVKTDGTIVLDEALASGDLLYLDGITYECA